MGIGPDPSRSEYLDLCRLLLRSKQPQKYDVWILMTLTAKRTGYPSSMARRFASNLRFAILSPPTRDSQKKRFSSGSGHLSPSSSGHLLAKFIRLLANLWVHTNGGIITGVLHASVQMVRFCAFCAFLRFFVRFCAFFPAKMACRRAQIRAELCKTAQKALLCNTPFSYTPFCVSPKLPWSSIPWCSGKNQEKPPKAPRIVYTSRPQ